MVIAAQIPIILLHEGENLQIDRKLVCGEDTDGEFWDARLKGVFKLDEITSTNPLAVGDDVELEPEQGEGRTAIITEIA